MKILNVRDKSVLLVECKKHTAETLREIISNRLKEAFSDLNIEPVVLNTTELELTLITNWSNEE